MGTPGSGSNVKSSSRKGVETMKSSLPPIVGFRFNPTDKVAVTSYLQNKAQGKALPKHCPIKDADVFGLDPRQIPGLASFESKTENEDAAGYFFTKRKRQQHSRSEVTRNGRGRWKPTSSSVKEIVDPGTGMLIGFKRRLAWSIPDSSGAKETHTKWIMKEYSLPTKRNKKEVKEEENQEEWVLCKIKWDKKERPQQPEETARSKKDDVVVVGKVLGKGGARN